MALFDQGEVVSVANSMLEVDAMREVLKGK